MKHLNWGDTLCGKEVTPEEWVDGVWAFREIDEWLTDLDMPLDSCLEHRPDRAVTDFRPIYPPRGWAGKSEWEIWQEMTGDSGEPVRVANGYSWELAITFHDKKTPLRLLCGTIERGEEYHDCAVDYEELRDPELMILALQNALVLATRLAPVDNPGGADTDDAARGAWEESR